MPSPNDPCGACDELRGAAIHLLCRPDGPCTHYETWHHEWIPRTAESETRRQLARKLIGAVKAHARRLERRRELYRAKRDTRKAHNGG